MLLSVLDEGHQTKAAKASFPFCGVRDSKNKVTKTFPSTQTGSGLCVPEEWRGASWGSFFQTCATPAATSTPGKLPERLKAQSCAEPPWQGLMFQVPLPSGHPPIHNPPHKNTLWGESCMSDSVRARQHPPNSSNAPLGFALLVSHNSDNSNRLNSLI